MYSFQHIGKTSEKQVRSSSSKTSTEPSHNTMISPFQGNTTACINAANIEIN
jgi:hypothetical protein